jgi:hypothetical protein
VILELALVVVQDANERERYRSTLFRMYSAAALISIPHQYQYPAAAAASSSTHQSAKKCEESNEMKF